ncbi:hypothetical protein [Streptomyces lavendulae]|uniref:hypothetical protein n=1 Tax=Streptomyces lavendulae TaxID=1914 RepID=UPI0024A5BBD4|nr:hypothetical protein Sros01_15040 [Streptomyces roseochromogenus]
MSSNYWELLFRDVTAEKLFALEGEAGEMDAASDYVEALLVVLAQWRRELETSTWRSEREGRAYQRSVDRVREAWLVYSFRNQATAPFMPDSFDIEVPSKRGVR